MNDLETRLRDLHVDVPRGTPLGELHRRATHARRRRRALSGVAGVLCVVAVLMVALVTVDRDDPPTDVRVGPDPVQEDTTRTRTLGDVDGVSVHVSPRTGLVDGELVEVEIEGLERLPGAVLLQCPGDVTEESATFECLSSVEDPQNPRYPERLGARDTQTVSVARIITVQRPDEDDPEGDGYGARPYDCATEPAGCVLAVGPYRTPVQAVVVPLEFTDMPIEPTASVVPASGVRDGDEVTLRASGLTPYRVFTVGVCEAAPATNCDTLATPYATVTSDGDGNLEVVVHVRAELFGFGGRTDCTRSQCVIALSVESLWRAVEAPFELADDVVVPVPEMWLEPDGPYEVDQVITVHGSGFPAGQDVLRQIAQCPADFEPMFENRCAFQAAVGAPEAVVLVEDDGTFTMDFRVSASLPFAGSCTDGRGCVIAWQLINGPIIVSVPLEFVGA